MQYTKLKEAIDGKKKAGSSVSDSTGLIQVSLQESAELRKVWDINDSRSKKIHVKVGEMIVIDYQPVAIVDSEGFRG